MLNEKKFRVIYDGLLESGLTIRDYCANQQINEAKFYYWQNKLKGQLPPKRGFVPVVFGNGVRAKSSQVPAPIQEYNDKTISCEINYPNGVQVKLNGLADLETLRSLLLLTPRQDV